MRVLVLTGGNTSLEREPSLANGEYVFDCLKSLPDLKVQKLDLQIGKNDGLAESIIKNGTDVVFVAQVGEEDIGGAVQAFLDRLHIPYTHSGFAAANICSDKAATKSAVERIGVPVLPTYFVGHRSRVRQSISDIRFPCVVKPVYGGSSVGVLVCRTEDSMTEGALVAGGKPDELVIVEQMASENRNLTVPVFRGKAMAVTEHATSREFFDYEAKTDWWSCITHVPANISVAMTDEIWSYAEAIYRELGCSGLTRSDFMIDRNRAVFIETNTHPVLKDRSLRVGKNGISEYSEAAFMREILRDAVEGTK